MLWLGFALGSAFFAGITAVLAKVGMKNVKSTLATAIRTVIVLVFSWWMVFLVGSQAEITRLSGRTLFYLVLSGLSTGPPGSVTSGSCSWGTSTRSRPSTSPARC